MGTGILSMESISQKNADDSIIAVINHSQLG